MPPVLDQANRGDQVPRRICRLGEWFARYPGNPLTIPQYGAWGVVHPDILFFTEGIDGYRFWLYYTPYPPATFEHPCLVRSHDGINFSAEGVTNPLIPGNAYWESSYLADVDVIKVGDDWYMYYLGVREFKPPYRIGAIGLAQSRDGINWTEYHGNPILSPTLTWENNWVGSPSVYYDGEKFWMWFAGNYYSGIELASSLDGIHWVRENSGMPVLSPTWGTWDGWGVSHPDVIAYRDTLWMYYWGYPDSRYYCLGLAKSVDKVHWTKCEFNPVLDTVQSSWDRLHIYRSSPVVIDDTMWLYYSAFTDNTHCSIGLAKSFDMLAGDADGNGTVDISDAVYMISFIFAGGPPAIVSSAGDADNSGALDISDVVFLVNYIFGGGPAPCTACR